MRIIYIAVAVLFLAQSSGRADMPPSAPPAAGAARDEPSPSGPSGEKLSFPAPPGPAAADSTELAGVPAWFWTYVPDVVWDDWREVVA
jgi:hypothetical protein